MKQQSIELKLHRLIENLEKNNASNNVQVAHYNDTSLSWDTVVKRYESAMHQNKANLNKHLETFKQLSDI